MQNLKITYTLACELRDAGFPQRDGAYYIKRHGKMRSIYGLPWYRPQHWVYAPHVKGAIKGLERTLENAYVPTLSELIDECDHGFKELCRLGEGGNFEWYTEDTTAVNDYVRIYGKTADEVVARLWLKLQALFIENCQHLP